MSPRNTKTGQVLERTVIPALETAGYAYKRQARIGRKPDGSSYTADLLVTDPVTGRRIVVSLKWQQVPGTAEQKIPFEVMVLSDLLESGKCAEVYLVLGGTGWTPTLKDFYLHGGLSKHMPAADRVKIVTLEEFIERANKHQL